MSGIFTTSFRAVRSLLPSSITTSDEKVGFARFHNEVSNSPSNPELYKMSAVNGVSPGHLSGKGSEVTTPAGNEGMDGGMEFPEFQDDGEDSAADKRKERNQISVWQAGWNVTNAIQVENSS